MATPTKTRVKFEAELFAQKLASDPPGFYCLDFGADFARSLAHSLSKQGWKLANKVHSKCKVATFEALLKKGDKGIHITSSVLVGPFTLIEGV